ncbi:MAG: hypothetical protein HON90_04410 [Halobacteriovoraceae bacterium]|jgi:hypothetical protein|nr:hypothetical protein [Halobacteriovoraceae bacterium]
MKNKIPYLLFTIVYLFINFSHPMNAVELHDSLLTSEKGAGESWLVIESDLPPKKIIKLWGHQLDLFYSYRHGSFFPLGGLRVLFSYFDYQTTLLMYHYLLLLLMLYLVSRYLRDKYDNQTSLIVLYLMSIDVNLLFAYRMDFTEPFSYFLFIYTLSLMGRNKNPWVVGVLLVYNFYLRINTLWFLPFYMLLEWKYLRISWRKLFLAGTCSLALYAFIVNPSGLFVDTLGMQKSLNPTHLLFDILNMFYNKTEYLSFYFDEQLKERVLSSIWAKLEFNFLGTLKLLTLLIIIFRKKIKIDELKPWLVAGLLSSFFLFISLQRYRGYGMYLHYLGIVNVIWVAFVIRDLFTQYRHLRSRFCAALLVVLIVCEVGLNAEVLYKFYKKGPVAWLDFHLSEQILKKLINKEDVIYTFGETDIKKFDVISKGEIKTESIHLDVSNHVFENIYELLAYKGKGIAVVPSYNYWTTFTQRYGVFTPGENLKLARKYDLDILNLTPYYDKNNRVKYWSFKFEVR